LAQRIDWGGAETVVTWLARELTARGHRVSVVAHARELPALAPAAPDVAMIFSSHRPFLANLRELAVAYAAGAPAIPIVAAEQNDLRVGAWAYWNDYEHYGALAACDAVQVLLPASAPMYPKALQSRITVIGNPALQVADAPEPSTSPYIIMGIGRFDEEVKRFSLLLRTWALLAPRYPGWILQLVGDGPAWGYYHALAQQLGIADRMEFTGSTPDPGQYYKRASILAMPSAQEGFPMVLVEASSWHVPTVAFRACESAAQLIPAGAGALAPEETPASLAATLEQLMALPAAQRAQMGATAAAYHQEHYAAPTLLAQWERLFTATIATAAHRGHTQAEALMQATGYPDVPWNAALLNSAARDLLLEGLEPGEEPAALPEPVLISKLQNKLAEQAREYKKLDAKYQALLEQFQNLAQHRVVVQGGQGQAPKKAKRPHKKR
jgi:glycosyltransferase involved in cell wall biosynthesis